MTKGSAKRSKPSSHGVSWLTVVTMAWVPLSVLLASTAPAEANPAWARKYNTTCTLCHSAWPTLNRYGRDFKLNGYRIPEELEDPEARNQMLDDFLSLDRAFPLAARLIMRPFDKTRDSPSKIRSFHEVELLVASHVGQNVSAWLEVEAEDEEDFNVFVEQGVLAFNPAAEANVAFGWAPPFWADPFATLRDGGHRMTRSHKGPLDQRFTARERLRDSSQFASFYGRAGQGRVFYLAGVSSGGGDPEGGDAKDGLGKVMVEVTTGVYVGGFIHAGANAVQGMDLDFRRSGFEFQVDQGKFNLYGLVMNAKDDVRAGGNESTTVGYVETFYTLPLERIPMVVPLARIDVLKDVTDLTLQLNFYLLDNVKAYAEWWQNVESPSGVRKNNRFTVQVDLAF